MMQKCNKKVMAQEGARPARWLGGFFFSFFFSLASNGEVAGSFSSRPEGEAKVREPRLSLSSWESKKKGTEKNGLDL